MDSQVYDYLSRMDHFSFLPEEDRRKLAEAAEPVSLSKGTRYAVQGETPIESVLIVREGTLTLYHEKDGDRDLAGHIKPGEVFGGITILMNGGISLRTVQVEEDSSGYKIGKDLFEDLCRRHEDFYEYFLAHFSHNVFDESLSAIIETGQTVQFLSGIEPFSFLPREEVEKIARKLQFVQYPEGTVLFVQGSSRVGYLYILAKGAAERYYEEDNQKTMREMLWEGDIYGGISMLLNDGISVRTFKVTEKSNFYLMPREVFMETCSAYNSFREYFTDIFGKRMLERSYAAIVSKALQPRQDLGQLYNQHVAGVYTREPIFSGVDRSIREVAHLMAERRISSVFLKDAEGKCVGVVTERDLARRVIATGHDPAAPVSEIMTSPVTTVPEYALVSEALIAMVRNDIRHLGVTDTDDRVIGVLTSQDLIAAQGQSPFFLIREVLDAASMKEIIDRHERLPSMVRSLISSGAKATNVNRIITTVSDAILDKVIGFALEEFDEPPVPFVFMIMGSEGRSEQTLKTDQDNAIIYEDVPESEEPAIHDYFLKFGDRVCTLLNEAGYDFCEGGVMAKNPKWCRPLAQWKSYFSGWIHSAGAEDLLQASIFFDFRRGYGEQRFIDELRKHLFDSLGGWSGFFRHLTENALHFKPPIGFFRNFVVESKGEHRNAFDIKSAMTPIVDFARLYALKNRIEETNTMERLHQLNIKEVLSTADYEELEKAYGFLMQLRFARQASAVLDEKSKPDNYINPKKLTRIEQKMLKEIFTRVEKFQSKIEFEFIGIV